MRTTMLCLFAMMVFYAVGFGQEKQDVIYLKNGDIRKGTIIENAPNDYIKIESEGGSTFTIKYADIQKMVKEAKPTSTSQQSSGAQDPQKFMMYESAKKSPTTGLLLSCLLTSAGHAYADNWPRGLLFTAGRAAGVVMALTLGVKTNTSYGGYYYSYTTETTEITAFYYIGMGIALVCAIWEMFDASAEVDRYNKRLYDKIMGTKTSSEFGINLVPTKEGGGKLVLSYSF